MCQPVTLVETGAVGALWAARCCSGKGGTPMSGRDRGRKTGPVAHTPSSVARIGTPAPRGELLTNQSQIGETRDGLRAEVLFDDPHRPLATKLEQLASSSRRVRIVTGFATIDGIRSLPSQLRSPNVLAELVIGAGTQRAFEAMDQLVSDGFPKDRLYVHLGYSRETTSRARYPFLRYHPMLHGKVYLFEQENARFAAVVGSNNLTNFALNGLNGEAAICLSGLISDPAYRSLVSNMDACRAQAIPYDPAMKDGYAWWMAQFLEGLSDKVMDGHRPFKKEYTLIVFCQGSGAPQPGSKLYIELPSHLYQSSLKIDVHGYVFDNLPRNASEALRLASTARFTFTGRLDGLLNKSAGAELLAGWELIGPRRILTRTSPPFRPQAGPRMQQALVAIGKGRLDTYVYKFDREPKWSPLFDRTSKLSLQTSEIAVLEELKLVPEEHLDWYRVAGLESTLEPANPQQETAAAAASEMFVLLSCKRAKFTNAG